MKLPSAKIRELQHLLNGLVDEAGDDRAQSHWELPVLPPPDPDGRLSSTDLLTWWFRTEKGGRGGWDHFFGAADEPAPGRQREVAARGPADAGIEPERPLAGRDPSIDFETVFPPPAEPISDDQAQGAVDCLYQFLHAFGRRDVEAAMSHVSDAYHTLEQDQEVDRLRFRQGLELTVDSLRDLELEVSLGEAPEPIWHPQGILIDARIQIDTLRPSDQSHGCLLNRRIAVLAQEADGDWRIRALSPLDR